MGRDPLELALYVLLFLVVLFVLLRVLGAY